MVKFYTEDELLDFILTKAFNNLEEAGATKLPNKNSEEGQLFLAIILGILDKSKPHGYFIPLYAPTILDNLCERMPLAEKEFRRYFKKDIGLFHSYVKSRDIPPEMIEEPIFKAAREVGRDFEESILKSIREVGRAFEKGKFKLSDGLTPKITVLGKHNEPTSLFEDTDVKTPRRTTPKVVAIRFDLVPDFRYDSALRKVVFRSLYAVPDSPITLEDFDAWSVENIEGPDPFGSQDLTPCEFGKYFSNETPIYSIEVKKLPLVIPSSYSADITLQEEGPHIISVNFPKGFKHIYIYNTRGERIADLTPTFSPNRRRVYDTQTGECAAFQDRYEQLDSGLEGSTTMVIINRGDKHPNREPVELV